MKITDLNLNWIARDIAYRLDLMAFKKFVNIYYQGAENV
jgi:hypothetical protein